MTLMKWDRTLDIGVEEMNREHYEILLAMNKVYNAHRAGERGQLINSLMARLYDVCALHFIDEERFMRETGFPGQQTHALIHKRLLHGLAAHAQAIQAAGGVADEAVFAFLRRWLVAHVQGVDIKYARHVNGDRLAS